MSRPWSTRLIILAVLAALGGAAALTVHTVAQTRTYRTALKLRTQDLEALSVIQADLAAVENARAVFDASAAVPPSLPDLARDLLPGVPLPELRDLSSPGPEGWLVRRYELSYDQVSMAAATTLALAAEAPLRDAAGHERPGWRLTRCAIRPLAELPGIGRVVLVLETLVKEGGQGEVSLGEIKGKD